jgi:hypothetical protein
LLPSSVAAPFSYRNTRGDPMVAIRSLMLTHVFNHGTHHRGQISVTTRHHAHTRTQAGGDAQHAFTSLAHLDAFGVSLYPLLFLCVCCLQAGLTRLGRPAPELDLLYMLNPAA